MFDPELHTIHKVETQHSGILFTLIPYIRRKICTFVETRFDKLRQSLHKLGIKINQTEIQADLFQKS